MADNLVVRLAKKSDLPALSKFMPTGHVINFAETSACFVSKFSVVLFVFHAFNVD